MFDHRLLVVVMLFCLPVVGCQRPAPPPPPPAPGAQAPAPAEDVAPPIDEGADLPVSDAPLAAPDNRPPGSLSCTTDGAFQEDIRVPVKATFDPNSDFVRFSLDSATSGLWRCSLVITHYSGVPEMGRFIEAFTPIELLEGAPEAKAFFIVESDSERWVADSLAVDITLSEDEVKGEFSGSLTNAATGAAIQIANGLFTAPLRRLISVAPTPSTEEPIVESGGEE